MAFALDIGVIFIFTVSAAIGYCRGFARYALKMLGTIVCVVLAFIASDLLSTPVYESFVQPRIEQKISEDLEKFSIEDTVRDYLEKNGLETKLSDEQLREALSGSGSIPQSVARAAEDGGADEAQAKRIEEELDSFFEDGFAREVCKRLGIENTDEMSGLSKGFVYDTVRALASGDSSEGAGYIAETAAPLIRTVVKYILFVIILIAAESVLAIIFAVAGIFDRIPAANGINRFLGLLAGMIKGALYILLIGFICSAVIRISGDYPGHFPLNTELINKTYIFRYIFYIFYK
ncbi:CvpA family protein [Ruminococcus sp. Marseille-P6503]|uniref:CvpA family protein n=1 Tax=Ruminococcus sp. Marseille-P6503 TaxID=2364796 RepID=UPI000F5381A1|nr:CvpA family protein [Ruminococcus sp. Marseille-P6503]